MDKNTKMWVAQSKAWLKGQENALKSCDIAIESAKKNIKNLQSQIRLELIERKRKVELINEVKKQIAAAK